MQLRSLFFKTRSRRGSPEPTPGDRVVYAIGDVHGRSDELDRVLTQIVGDARRLRLSAKPVLIFLGDYVDRGADSRGAIDRILALKAGGDFEIRALKGNHEEAMLAFLEDPAFGPTWTEHGGSQTLASYGVAPPMRRSDAGDWERARDQLGERLPTAHFRFLSSLELMAAYGDYLFVHAGVRPGVPIAEQQEHDLLWIREPFLSEPRPCEKVVVHGHTPTEAPFLGRGRIGIDTGAYATGVLTAVRLSGPERKIFQSRGAFEDDRAALKAAALAKQMQPEPE